MGRGSLVHKMRPHLSIPAVNLFRREQENRSGKLVRVLRIELVYFMESKEDVFQWRQNTSSQRRRMRNDRKKRKRLQGRKRKSNPKVNAVVEDLTERLRNESEQRERLLLLARKYYSKWKQSKDALKSFRASTVKMPSFSRFGTQQR